VPHRDRSAGLAGVTLWIALKGTSDLEALLRRLIARSAGALALPRFDCRRHRDARSRLIKSGSRANTSLQVPRSRAGA
jgi:hypothetical protein